MVFRPPRIVFLKAIVIGNKVLKVGREKEGEFVMNCKDEGRGWGWDFIDSRNP